MALTRCQREVLDFLRGFVEEHGYCPSFEEIGRGMEYSSLATVHKHISSLEKKGYLRRSRNCSRSIDLVNPDLERRREQRALAARQRLPLLGRIAAGRPLEAIETQDSISLADIAGQGEVFALQVQGDSMIDEHIMEGDYVLVEKDPRAYDGQLVVALVDGQEATLKRFYLERRGEFKGKVRLQPSNSRLDPMYFPPETVQVQGHVVGILRRY